MKESHALIRAWADRPGHGLHGSLAHGQGTETTFAQIVADELGVPRTCKCCTATPPCRLRAKYVRQSRHDAWWLGQYQGSGRPARKWRSRLRIS